MLRNYSMLKGTITKDLEDHVKKSKTHYNLLVTANDMEYQVNIDVQSLVTPDVKIFIIKDFDNSVIHKLSDLGDEGLFTLNNLMTDCRLDYVRSHIFTKNSWENITAKPWQAISDRLDQYIVVGSRIQCLGEYYDDQQVREEIPHGLLLRKLHNDLPPRGIHDIHLNQGTSLTMSQANSNGIYQDGALLIESNRSCSAFFFMFTTQTLNTDSSGNPLINN